MCSDRAPGTPPQLTEELLFWFGADAESSAESVAPQPPQVVIAEEPEEPRRPSPEPARAVIASPARAARHSRRLVTVLGAVAAAAVVFAVYSMGKPAVPAFNGKAADEASTSASQAPVDTAKVADLMKKISANAKDVASLLALGDLYFQAGDYKNASLWERKVLAVDPKNTTALLALGAAQFNLGNANEAEKSWLQVVALDPRKAEAHYDLGFLYLSKTPPDMAKVRKEWSAVVAIDPTSDIAKTVATHLKSIQSSAAPGTSGK